MKPSCREFSELLSRLLDGDLSEDDRRQFEQILESEPDARMAYLDLMEIDALLDIEMASPLNPLPVPRRRLPWPRRWLAPLAASLLLGLIALAAWHHYIGSVVAHVALVGSTGRNEFPTSWKPGDAVRLGDSMELPSGWIQLEFKSGAMVVLEGPGRLVVDSAMRCRLVEGTLTAEVSKSAVGFVVATHSGTVRDLGTRFCVAVDKTGDVDVHVVQGRVEASVAKEKSTPSGVVGVEESKAVRLAADSSEIRNVPFSVDRFETSLSLIREIVRSEGPLLYIRSAPVSLDANQFENDQHAALLAERQVVLLKDDLPVDIHYENASHIPSGTSVDSYLVHFDAGTHVVLPESGECVISGSLTFRRPILGAITSPETLLDTDSTVGLPDVIYPTKGLGLARRGSQERRDSVELVDRHTIKFRLTTMPERPESCGVDQLRILVAATNEAN